MRFFLHENNDFFDPRFRHIKNPTQYPVVVDDSWGFSNTLYVILQVLRAIIIHEMGVSTDRAEQWEDGGLLNAAQAAQAAQVSKSLCSANKPW